MIIAIIVSNSGMYVDLFVTTYWKIDRLQYIDLYRIVLYTEVVEEK